MAVTMMNRCVGGKVGEKEKRSSSCNVRRSGTEDSVAVRNRLMWVACTVTWRHVMSGPVTA